MSTAFQEAARMDAAKSILRSARSIRTVVVGPWIRVMFENAQTFSFRLQELEALARRTNSAAVRSTRAWYHWLLPRRNRLTAALWIGEPGRRLTRDMEAFGRGIASAQVLLVSADLVIPGRMLPQSSFDRVTGIRHWVELSFTETERLMFADADRSWHLAIRMATESLHSEPFTPELMGSLRHDLQLN